MARNGREALDLARTDRRIDIVQTDLVMPGGLSGQAVAHEIAVLQPGAPVVITTGYDPYKPDLRPVRAIFVRNRGA